jgi:hypothetical protein
MIGFIYVRDIPKLIVSVVVVLFVFGAIIGGALCIPGFPELARRAPEWLDLVVVLLLFWASMAAGELVWEWVDFHLPDSPRQKRHVSEVMELYKHTMQRDIAVQRQQREAAQRLQGAKPDEKKVSGP